MNKNQARKIKPFIFIFLLLGLSSVSGCATSAQKKGLDDIEKIVKERTTPHFQTLDLHWYRGTAKDVEVQESVGSMLQGDLSVYAALQIALLNNRSLQSTFEQLGIAQADLLQAGFLENPHFSAEVRFPEKSTDHTNTEFAVTQNILDFIFLPLRKKIAKEQLEQTKSQIAEAILNLIAEVKLAYYELQSAVQVEALQQTVLQAAKLAAEFSKRQYEAGNINELEWATQQSFVGQAKLDLIHSKEDILMAREHLIRLMGLSTYDSNWNVLAQLKAIPAAEPPLIDLEELALSQRFDLIAARQEIKILQKRFSLAQIANVDSIDVGVSTERDPDGERVIGPTFDLEVPIFERGQGTNDRLQAQIRQSKQQLLALENKARSEVRTLLGQLRINRQMVEAYRDTVIPLRTRIIGLAQKHYNYMLIGVFQMLEAKQDEVKAQLEYIESVRDYWIARAQLERAVGGRLFMEESVPPALIAPSSESMREKHEHHEHGGKTW